MGLEGYDNSGKVFLHLKYGHLCQTSKSEIEGWTRFDGTTKDGTKFTKWYKAYRAVSGYVTKIEKYEKEFGNGWNISIDADGVKCNLDIPFASRANGRWLKLAENIDWSKPVRFSAWQDKKTDTLAFNVQQDGVTVPQKYTREDPGDMPEPIQRASGKWDYGAQEDFLVERMMNVVIPAVEAAQVNAALRNETSDESNDAGQGLEDHSETSGAKEALLARLQKSITEYSSENQVSKAAALEEWFGTKNWAEITKMEEAVLKAVDEKLTDLLVPF
jgi:hypothetical protein